MVEPAQFGRYTVVREIATTIHSVVLEATDIGGAPVAIKQLKVRRVDREPYRRFRDEVAFHKTGPHRGVLPLLDADVPEHPTSANPAWLAMPIAKTVRATLGSEPTLDQIVDAVQVYAATLAGLAEKCVYHRDLKPDNLFWLDDQWLVGDFGLVTWPGKQALTEPGQKLGPAHFVAPEMVENPGEADAGPADVWSLAKVLWVLASGQNYPPPGQLRIGEEATLLRSYNSHPRAAGLEGILEQATGLAASTRPTMRAFAMELETWSTPPEPPREPLSIEHLVDRVSAISEPEVRAQEEQAVLHREAAAMSDCLRAAHKALRPNMERLGRVFVSKNQGLILHLGGGTGRRDVALRWDESLTLGPRSQHRVSLTIDIAWELFNSWDIHLAVGIYLRIVNQLPDVFMLETRDVRLGTEHGGRAGHELVQHLIDEFLNAANRYAELLADAEAQAQQNRQPHLESVGTNYVFRTAPEAGFVTIIDRSNGSVDGHAVAWFDAPLVEIRADGDRLWVRTSNQEGWIERTSRENWALTNAQPRDQQ